MKRKYLTIILIMTTICLAQPRNLRVNTPNGIVEIHDVEDTIYIGTIVQNIQQRIAKLQDLKDTHPECYGEISSIALQISQLISLVPRDAISIPVQAIVIEPMSAEAFANFVLLLEDKAFADDKLLFLKQVIAKNYLTTHQLGKIVDQFTFSDDKLKAVKIALPRLTDSENIFMLRDKFSLDSDKEKFMKLISE